MTPWNRPSPILFALLILGVGMVQSPAATQNWLLKDGTELYGEATQYNFKTKSLTIHKADGKDFEFDAGQLSFSGKVKLINAPAFGQALKSYSPPILPSLAVILLIIAFVCIPTFVGLWGGAHVQGAIASPLRHLAALGKLLLVIFLQFWVWFVAALVLDPRRPVIPDNQLDVLILMTVGVLGFLAAAFVVSRHYQQTFWKGLSITLLSGAFGAIVGVAMVLTTLFLAMRNDTETLVTKLVFEPFGWF